MPKKGGLGQFVDSRGGGLGKKEGAVFLRGGLIPQCLLCNLLLVSAHPEPQGLNIQNSHNL